MINNRPIPIHGNGKNIRFYLSALDFANALILLVKRKIKEHIILEVTILKKILISQNIFVKPLKKIPKNSLNLLKIDCIMIKDTQYHQKKLEN